MLTLSVIPTSVQVGESVHITVTARNDYSPSRHLDLKTTVWRWCRIFLWIWKWRRVQDYPGVGLNPSQPTEQSYSYAPTVKAKYKAEAGLYDTAGRAVDTRSVEFRAT